MSLTEVREGQAQSLVKPKSVAPSVVKVSNVVAPSKNVLPSKFDVMKQEAEKQTNTPTAPYKPTSPSSPTMGPAALRPGETKEQYTERITPPTPPKDTYVPPSPGIRAGFENGVLVERTTLSPGQGSNLKWEPTPPVTNITTVTSIDQLTGLPPGPDKAAAIKAFSQGETVTLTSTSQGYELKGYITNQNKTEGIEPARKMSSGEIISSRFTKPGYDIFYGKQTGPEQMFSTAGDVRLTTGPSTKSIMAEIGSTIAVTLPLGTITKISMGATKTLFNPTTGKAIGTLGKVYQYGVKPAFIGVGVAGIGAQTYFTASQLQTGKTTTRQVSIDVLNLGVGFASFGVTGGASNNMWNKFKVRTPGDILTSNKRIVGRINKANQLGLKTGNIESNYNNIRIGRPGKLLGSSDINIKQNILDIQGNKIGEQFTLGNEGDFISGSRKAELNISFPGSKSPFGKSIEMVYVGGSKAINKIIPGVENPRQTDVFTTMKYRTGELQGVIKTGKIIKYTKLSPEYAPYVDNTPWGFKKTPLKFEKVDTVDWFKESSGAKAIDTVATGPKLKSYGPSAQFRDIKLGLTETPNISEVKLIKSQLQSYGKESTGVKATTIKGKIKNFLNPDYWIPTKDKLLFNQKEFVNIKLNEKTGLYEQTTESQDWFGKSSGKAVKDYSKPFFNHDIKQGAIDYLTGLAKYKAENKPKLNLKSNAYTGGAKSIGTTSGGLALESQRPLSSFEKALLRSEIEQTPIFNVYPPARGTTPRLGPIITPVTSIKTITTTQADYAGVMSKRFTSLGFKTETKTDRIQTSNRDTTTRNTARTRLFGVGIIDLVKPRQTTRQEQRQMTSQKTETQMTFKNMFMNNFEYKETVIKRPPYLPGVPFAGMSGGGEGGRGYDDWEHYFRKRKFNIGSINQAFGIGMKPMKIKGDRKQWAF